MSSLQQMSGNVQGRKKYRLTEFLAIRNSIERILSRVLISKPAISRMRVLVRLSDADEE
jgi:hypothetical protein